MLVYGFSVHERIYRRDGGRIMWGAFPIRGQNTIARWKFDGDELVGVEQVSPNTYRRIFLPIEKVILFRSSSYKNNPEGRSILRNAYRPWYFKQRIEEIEGIGIERDLAGLPVAYVPPEILSGSASAEAKASLGAIKNIIRNIRRDEQEGVVFPLAYNQDGGLAYKLELMSTGGRRQFNTSEIIGRYDKRILMVALADFVMLGQDKVGSFALSSDKTAMFSMAIKAWLDGIVETLNSSVVAELFELNGIRSDLPKIKYTDIETRDVDKFAKAVYALMSVGALTPTESVEIKARELLDISTDDMVEGAGI
jgi:hypothetical protein